MVTNILDNGKDINIKPDSIKITGLVEIKNGDNIIRAQNKFTQSMLAWLNNMCSISYVSNSNVSNYYWYISSNAWDIYIGQDQSTPTAYNTIALTNPIGTSANSKNASTNNPLGGVFNIVYSATWNVGTVSGTIGEMALYMRVKDTLQPFGWSLVLNNNIIEAEKLVSRLSAKDGNFSPFTIDNTHPLIITWTVSFSFS